MSVTVDGLYSLEEMFLTLDTTTKKRVKSVLIKEALAVQALAIKMAPIDHGNLEKAILVRGAELGATRNELGQFSRVEVEVYVNMDMPIKERPGKTIGDYAYEIHEHLEPAGGLQLGPKSQRKQSNNGGIVVGGWYLDRALQEVDGKIDLALVEIARD